MEYDRLCARDCEGCVCGWLVGWLLAFYVLATSKDVSGRVPTWQCTLCRTTPLGDQAASTGLACRRSWVRTHGWVNPMTYKIEACHFLARCSALMGQDNDWLAQCQDNPTQWDIRSWCRQLGFPVGQHYKVVMGAHCHKSVSILMTLDVVRTYNNKLPHLSYLLTSSTLNITSEHVNVHTSLKSTCD